VASSAGVMLLDLVGVGQAAYADHLVHAQLAHIHIDVTGMSASALDLNLAQHLIENAALAFTPIGMPSNLTRTDAQNLVERDALQVDVNQLVLNRSRCQSTIMALRQAGL